ncbi:hypothetical protein ACHAO1_010372 [Botrytis cinerea]
MGICVYYPIGRCVAGDQCHKKHTGPYQPYPCKHFVFYGECKWGLDCRFGHPARIHAENPEPTRPACKNFLSRRGCQYGWKCHSHHPVATEKGASSATLALPTSQFTMATPGILKAARTANAKSAKAKPADTTVAPLRNFCSARLFLQKSRVATITPTVSSIKDAVNVDSSYEVPAGKIPAPFMGPSSLEVTLPPTECIFFSNDTSDTGAISTGSSYDQLDGTVTTPSKSSGSPPGSPSFQVLTPASTNIGNADDIGYMSSTDTIPMSDDSELVRSATRSPSPVDDSHDTSISTVSDESSTLAKLIQLDSESTLADNANVATLSEALENELITPLSNAPAFASNQPASGVQLVDQGHQGHLLDPPVHGAPGNSGNNITIPSIPIEASTASSYIAPTESFVDPEQASVAQYTNRVSSPNKSAQTIVVAPVEENQISVMEHVPTEYQSAMDKLSRVVVDWSVASETSNLELLSGPGMHDCQMSYTEILCPWPQEWDVPAIDMINTLVHLASTWGELAVFQPIHRNMGSWHSLQIRFRHRHEAAAAAAAMNGHLITAVGAYMSIPVTVSHQIEVQYLIPRYIVDSLGRTNQGILHQIFGQNFCQLHLDDSYRVDHSGKKLMEVKIMGTCEKQVARCKAVLEDLLRGRVLTHEEGDNRPLWHKFFKTEEGAKWIRKTLTNVFDMKARVSKIANLDILMVYGSSEWSRARFGELVKKKIAELEKAAIVTAIVTEELRLMRLRIKG